MVESVRIRGDGHDEIRSGDKRADETSKIMKGGVTMVDRCTIVEARRKEVCIHTGTVIIQRRAPSYTDRWVTSRRCEPRL
jgi:hypothetical protein